MTLEVPTNLQAPADLDPGQPGLVVVAWQMIRQMQAETARLRDYVDRLEAGEKAAADRRRLACGIPSGDHA